MVQTKKPRKNSKKSYSKTSKRKSSKKTKATQQKANRHKAVKRWSDRFFKRVGVFMVGLISFLILMGMVLFLWMNRAIEDYQDQAQQEAVLAARQNFIHELAPTAQRLQRQYGVLASISLAQAALESDFGQSELSANYYNLYGVKTDSSDEAGVDFNTLEHVDGEWIEIVDRFKVYPSWEVSMERHAELIYYGTSWDSEYYHDVLNGTTYHEQAAGLQNAGYATDPDYADKIVEMIETWNLSQYDQLIQ